MELGNAFTEINDSEEQAARFAMQADEGAGGNVEAEPGDPDYVEALSYGMPPTGGLGMGIDRLAMLLLGKESIRDVILFPALRVQVTALRQAQESVARPIMICVQERAALPRPQTRVPWPVRGSKAIGGRRHRRQKG